MDDDFTPPVAMEPEDLYDDLREQTAMTRLAEGLLAFADTDFAIPVDDEPEANDMTDPILAAS